MKWLIRLMLPALVLASCSKEGGSLVETAPAGTREKVEVAGHERIELGSRLENPYSVDNIGKALASVYPTRAVASVPVSALYVRFLPKDLDEYSELEGKGLQLFDHPLDYEILTDGDYYHDPSIPDDEITWQYAVVPSGFEFPSGIRYEILEDCFIPEDGMATRGFEDVDWDAVERQSFKSTGNAGILAEETRAKVKPSGRITIKDEKLGKAVGVSGVKVVANVFVKISTTYTDADGKYAFPAKFSARPRYSICFQNKLGFTIGMNLILVPASVSTLGKDDPDGIDVTVDRNSDNTLFRRCAVNNAAYDYYRKCPAWGVSTPPKNLRFWILNIVRPSCALMMHHGALLDTKLVSNYLGVYSVILRVFSPDITIGAKDKNGNYPELYASTVHEMAHASHFVNAGTAYWDTFATYILSSFLMTGSTYGTGNGENAGYCAVAEIWAYHIENMMLKERYGTNPGYGKSNWFHPELLSSLESGGIGRDVIFSCLKTGVNDLDLLKEELVSACPSKKTVITQAFNKYAK